MDWLRIISERFPNVLVWVVGNYFKKGLPTCHMCDRLGFILQSSPSETQCDRLKCDSLGRKEFN